jgi:FMN phosphatase YigB (HAD superfamily)
MNNPRNIKQVLVDFDGVISKNSLDITLLYAYDFINKYTPYHINSLKNYYLSINSFELKDGLALLFNSLGIGNELGNFYLGLKRLKEHNGQVISIEPDYQDFISFCKDNQIGCKIFSLSDDEKIENLLGYKPDHIKWTKGLASKANPKTFSQICELLKYEAPQTLVVDDDPFVLRSAKIAGLSTILMQNLFFKGYTENYRKYFDDEVRSFSELKLLLTIN